MERHTSVGSSHFRHSSCPCALELATKFGTHSIRVSRACSCLHASPTMSIADERLATIEKVGVAQTYGKPSESSRMAT